jgi:hypothetical protein
MKKILTAHPEEQKQDRNMNDNLSEYPLYPDSEDIYNKSRKENNIDPEDISKVKDQNTAKKVRTGFEDEYESDKSGSDLDVPGSELDDERENIGNEDEENNYYSIGGDDHNDLDEDKDAMNSRE